MFRLMRLLKLVTSSAILRLEVMRLKTLIQRPQSSWLWEFDWDVPIPSMCGILTIIYQHEYHKNHPSRVSKYTNPSHESIYGFFVKKPPPSKTFWKKRRPSTCPTRAAEVRRIQQFDHLLLGPKSRFAEVPTPEKNTLAAVDMACRFFVHLRASSTKRVSRYVTVSNYGSWKVPLILGGKKPFFNKKME